MGIQELYNFKTTEVSGKPFVVSPSISIPTEDYNVGYVTKGEYTDLISFYRRFFKDTLPESSTLDLGKILKQSEHFKDCLYRDGDFSGSSAEEFFTGKIDKSEFMEFKKRHSSSKVMKKIKDTFGEENRRVRTRSEYDGDYDFDKKWDNKPYSASVRTKKPVKIVKFKMDLSFSAHVSADIIKEYGFFMAMLIEQVEATGVMCELTVIQPSRGVLENGSSVGITELLLKRSNEYMSSSEIIRCISPGFLRRVMFAHKILTVNELGHEVDSGLGYPVSFNCPFEKTEDGIHFHSVPDHSQQREIIDVLSKFLKGDTSVSGS